MKNIFEDYIEKTKGLIPKKIHYKILIPFLIILIITTLAGMFFTMKALDEFSERRISNSINEDLALFNNIIQETNDQVLFYSRFMADAEKLSEVLAQDERSRNILILLIQTLRENRMLMEHIKYPDPNRPDFLLLRKGFLGIRSSSITIFTDGDKRSAYIQAVSPIEEKSGIKRVISVKFPIDEKFLKSIKSRAVCEVSIYLPGGLFISTVDDPECKHFISERIKDFYERKQGKSISERIKCNKEIFETLISHLKLNDQNFGIIAISIPISDIISAKRSFIINMLPYMILSSLILIVIYNYIIKNMTDPLKKLSIVAKEVARGNIQETHLEKSNDEIGELVNSFEYMIGELRNYRKSMEQWTAMLESEIEKRTKELKETHMQLAKTGRLAALGELSAGVAHELNNPIGAILGYAQYTLEKIADKKNHEISNEDFERIKRFLSNIEKEAQRCRNILHNLLKFSRGAHMAFELLDVNEVINETLVFASHHLRINNVELIMNLDQNIPKIKGSAHHLQQVFTNIIINAQQAMPGGGKLYIETRSVKKGNEISHVEIEFRDTGHGIPEEIQDKIFEPFFTTREPGKGTGLGLAVSYGIIKEHNGEIKVKSKPGEGASFIISLPSAG